MAKRSIALGLLLCLALSLSAAYARSVEETYGQAVIDGGSADRVNLREGPTTDSRSLGLYFTGTQVMYERDAVDDWTFVLVGGNEAGYIKTEFLAFNAAVVAPRQPMGVVSSATGKANLRLTPSVDTAVADTLTNGTQVTVLGETASGWYYVHAGTFDGFIRADLLTVGSAPAPSAAQPLPPSAGYAMQLYTEAKNDKSHISIQYPRFNGDGMDAVNAMVLAKVQCQPQAVYDDYSDAIGLTMDYQAAVTLQNSRVISVVFWGSSYVEGGAHPTTDLFTLNLDLNTLREITLPDLYTLNAEFEKAFFAKAAFPSAPLTAYDEASFSDMLAMQTPEYQTVSPFAAPDGVTCFLKPEGIVISLPAIHATGSDHFEAQLSYADLQPFYRLSQNLWED